MKILRHVHFWCFIATKKFQWSQNWLRLQNLWPRTRLGRSIFGHNSTKAMQLSFRFPGAGVGVEFLRPELSSTVSEIVVVDIWHRTLITPQLTFSFKA